MIEINRKSKEVILNGGRAQSRLYLIVRGRQIFFTTSLVIHCELKPGMFIHFINDGNVWDFYTSDNPDGFLLVKTMRKDGDRKSLIICNAGLVNMILKSTGFKNEKRFAVEDTERMKDHSRIFRLSLENVSTVNR